MPDDIETRLRLIEERNARVEGDKAWEVSFLRRAVVAGITYIVAFAALRSVGSTDAATAACIPLAGYIVSTLSLPMLKDWWIRRRT